jgi:4-nitrophenyl phosphatase
VISEVSCSLNDLSHLNALILDIDGVLYEGNHALLGAVELIENLNTNDTPYVLFSNNTTNTIENHLTKLSRLGMRVPAASIITAASIAAKMIAQEAASGTRCFVIGEAGLVEALLKVGLEVTQSEAGDVKYVVIGMDRKLTYEKLKIATRAILNGAQFISTNADPVYMDGDGIIPASGSIQAALEAATGIQARMTGKPEPAGFLLALNQLGCSAEETGMLGDQPEIDLLGASRVGIKTCLIRSSLTAALSPRDSQIVPDAVFNSTLEFYQEWIKSHPNTS